MFDDPHKRTFFNAPQSVTTFVAALLEPGISVLTFVLATLAFDPPLVRKDMVVCMLVLALTFPGRNRFRDSLLGAAVDIASSWLILLGILALCAVATQMQADFHRDVLLTWVVTTPILQWLATSFGKYVLARKAARPESRRSAVVVGASALGTKVAWALQESDEMGVEFVGYFDDRLDERIDPESQAKVLGNLGQIADYVVRHGVRDVYITLPLGSQPRIVDLLEQLQGTTASLFFVPDVFGISIIQGRLEDMNGIPVVGI